MRRLLIGLVAGLFATTPAANAAVIAAVPGDENIGYVALLDGPTAGNASPGTGDTTIYIDYAETLIVMASWNGLSGTTTAAHLHCCTGTANSGTAVVATTLPRFFPTGLTSGNYGPAGASLNFEGTYTPEFLAAAGGTAAAAKELLLNGMNTGRAYFDIQTTAFPDGEISGFLTLIPVPAAVWLFGSAIALLGIARRKPPDSGQLAVTPVGGASTPTRSALKLLSQGQGQGLTSASQRTP